MKLESGLIKKIFNFFNFLFSLIFRELRMTLIKILLRFTILVATNFERSKCVLFTVYFIAINILVIFLRLSRKRQFLMSLNFFRLKLIYLVFRNSLCCCFIKKIWFFFLFGLVSYFLANTSYSKWSKFLMYLRLIFMTIAVILRSLFYYPVIRLSWTWTVHILRTNPRYRQFFSRRRLLLVYSYYWIFYFRFYCLNFNLWFLFFRHNRCVVSLVVKNSFQSFE